MRKDLVDIVGGLRQYCSHIGMTTNGVTLSRHLDRLVDAGLSHINISLDTLMFVLCVCCVYVVCLLCVCCVYFMCYVFVMFMLCVCIEYTNI